MGPWMNNSSIAEILTNEGRLVYFNVGDSMRPLIRQGRESRSDKFHYSRRAGRNRVACADGRKKRYAHLRCDLFPLRAFVLKERYEKYATC